MKIRLHSEAKILILLGAIHAVVGTFFGTFLIAYIMQISTNESVSLSVYNMAYFAALMAGFLLLADFVKRRDKMLVYRAGIVIQGACLAAIALAGDGIAPFVALFGAVYGIALAFRYCPFNIITGEKIKRRMMIPFSGYKATIGGIVSVLTPLFLGLFIEVGSYEKMAMVMGAFLLLDFALSFFLRSPAGAGRFSLGGFMSGARRSILVRRVYLSEFLAGLTYSGPMGVVATMFIMYAFGGGFSLGLITSIFAGVAIAASFALGRWGTMKSFPRLIKISNVVIAAAAAFFVAMPGAVAVILWQFANATALRFLTQVQEINVVNASNSACVGTECRAEFFVAREMMLTFGRILGFVILLTIGMTGRVDWLKWYLALMAAGVIVSGVICAKICRRGFRK
ncbi:MAG: hypothetical protein LBL46_03585 [Rickettsiales bacterium]|jgi:YQGE family putative transporter|nr:hypothetical protein [Rickettsiales bacterium]